MNTLTKQQWDQKMEAKKAQIIQEWENTNITYDLIARLINQVPKHKEAMVRDVNTFNRLRDYKHRVSVDGQCSFENIQIHEMDMILKWKKILAY